MLAHSHIFETQTHRCYYALQGIHNQRFDEHGTLVECITDAERETERLQWVNAYKTSLPASFRIGKDVPASFRAQLARELDEMIQQAIQYVPPPPPPPEPDVMPKDNNNDDEEIIPTTRGRSSADYAAALVATSVQKLSFLSDAHQLSLDRVALRKNPALKQLQDWLKTHSAEGHITRQGKV
jgi:hypothetical protein